MSAASAIAWTHKSPVTLTSTFLYKCVDLLLNLCTKIKQVQNKFSIIIISMRAGYHLQTIS